MYPPRNSHNTLVALPSRRVPPPPAPSNPNVKSPVRFLLVVLGAVFCFLLGMTTSVSVIGHNSTSTNPLEQIYVENSIQQRLATEKEAWKKQQEKEQKTTVESAVAERMAQLEVEMKAKQDKLVLERVAEEVAKQCSGLTNEQEVEDLVKARVARLETEREITVKHKFGNTSETLFPKESVGKYAVGMAYTTKADFTDHISLGVPVDLPDKGYSDVLILYSRDTALPTGFQHDMVNHMDTEKAVENCDYLNVILTDHGGQRRQCVAIVPQYESYHVFKYMRIDAEKRRLDSKGTLQQMSRGFPSNGKSQFIPPPLEDTQQNWAMLQKYLQNLPDVLKELKEILEKIAQHNTVVVMVCNFGQSVLLMNFVCAAKSRSLDISNVLVFTTDQETKDLAESLGLSAFYDHRVRYLAVYCFCRVISLEEQT
jgi:hypothetical protein